MKKSTDGFGGFDADFGTDPSAPVVVGEPKKGKKQGAVTPAVTLPRAKKAKQQLSPKEKTLLSIARKSDVPTLPPLATLIQNMAGTKMKIKDIALFTGKPSDPVLAELAAGCPLKNSVNLSAEVQKKRLVYVGIQIVKANRMYTPIQIAKIGHNYECVSGRNRLAFLALAYGVESEIPVTIQEMTLNEARDAVVVANQSRRAEALEQAEHMMLKAVQGNASATLEEIYGKGVVNRASLKKYCTFSVRIRDLPEPLSFTVAKSQARKEGGIMLLGNIEVFFGAALDWKYGMPLQEFNANFVAGIKFLNALVAVFTKQSGFDPKSHMSSKTMIAVGKFYKLRVDNKASTLPLVGHIAKAIIDMGDVGKQKSELTYKMLMEAMTGK